MSYTVLRYNIETLIKENSYQIADLERKAGLKKNNIYYILRGYSKKPSFKILEAIAAVFGKNVQDLFKPLPAPRVILTSEQLDLVVQINQISIKIIREQNISISFQELNSVISHIYDYYTNENTAKADVDEQFVKWLIKQKLANNLN